MQRQKPVQAARWAQPGVVCGIVLVAGTIAALAGDEGAISPSQTFADKSAADEWFFSDGPEWPGAEGDLEWRPGAGRDGDGALALRYDFTGGGHYCAAIAKLPRHRPVKAVRLYVHKPAANLMIFRGVDIHGEAFQKDFQYHYPGWQQLEISLGDWAFHWGGDGVFQPPAREFHILVENDGGTRQGEILIDDVQWVFDPQGTATGGLRRTTYVESDFGSGDRWHYDGPAPGRFLAPQWKYQFTPERPRVRLVRDRGILGKPVKMMLSVTGDGSGHELVARFGSHFQLFERSLGTLDKVGKMTFEVPLGDMKTWRHFGGEDDGIVRYPLRLIELALVKQGDGDSGSLPLNALAFETEYDPDTQTVWVVPQIAEHDDENVVFALELRSLADKPLRGTLHWSLHSADRRLDGGARELTLRDEPIMTRVEGDWRGLSVIEGRFQFVSDEATSQEFSKTLARVPEGQPDLTLNPDSRMGVGMYLYRFHGHPEGKLWMERMCRLAAQAGVKWTREEFHWNWMEPKEGEWDFTFFDQLVETANAHGISVYALCCYWTAWTEPYTDEGIEDYCNYLETLVRRYGDRIKHWEIWNEPNIFFWGGPREVYIKALRRAYETIKEADREAQVLGCSTAGIDTTFIQLVLDNNGPFDALTVHPYRGTLDVPKFVDELRAVQKQVSGRDVWITEMGWPSQIGGLSERDQAQHVARTYIGAFASGSARTVAWYDFREDGTDPFYNEHHFGLVRHDLEPKMGYRALAAVGQLVGPADPVGPLDLGAGILGYAFRKGAQQVAAFWSLDKPRLLRLAVSGENVRFVNMVGDPAHVATLDETRVLLLPAKTPIYVLSDGRFELTLREPPVRVQSDRLGVHPGEAFELRLERAAGVTADLQVPEAWAVAARDGDARYRVTPPADARPGTHRVRVEVRVDDTEFVLPLSLEVVPLLLRG